MNKNVTFLLLGLLAQRQLPADDFLDKLKAAEAARPRPAAPAAAPAAPKPKALPKPDLSAIEARLSALESPKPEAPAKFKAEALLSLRYDRGPAKGGAYLRRAEAKASAQLGAEGKAVLGYDFAENKLKDAGCDLGWLQVGQFRQKFGIEPQTGSSKIPFAERAVIYGGAQPTALGLKLFGERAMGLHAQRKLAWGACGIEAGASFVDSLGEDQAAGKNKISALDAFPKQAVDEGFSYCGRLGLAYASRKLTAGLGASYGKDPQRGAFDELLGFDARLEWANLAGLQGEWVSDNSLRAGSGLFQRREGWVLTQSLQPLRLFMSEPPKIELLARYEAAARLNAATAGLKWGFWDGQHLLLQASTFALGGDFNAFSGGPAWTLQQQLVF
jgi:hypothetical protein